MTLLFSVVCVPLLEKFTTMKALLDSLGNSELCLNNYIIRLFLKNSNFFF